VTSKSSAKSSGRKKREPIPQPHGGAIIPGAGGGPQPGAGRPTDEFKAMCRELVTRDATWKAVQAILKDPEHSHYMSALKWASEHGYGKPTETVEVTGKDGGPIQVWKWGKREIKF
jgi:hypothetical protein